jgi:flavin-dependent dehydrogenase
LNSSIAIFRRAKRFDMHDIQMTSGFGGLASAFWQPTTRPIVVGEAAGFQDFLWGFGIRYALFSGHLAAQALDQGCSYETLVARELRPLVRSSMVNRLLYDWAGDRTYRALMSWFSASPDLPALTRRWYRGLIFRRLLWPIAKRRYRKFSARPEQDNPALLRRPFGS